MKITVISDWHGDFELVNCIPRSDVICVCGDMIGRMSDFAIYPLFLENLPAKLVFFIPGNHDVLIKEDWEPKSDKVFNLSQKTIKYKEVLFGGFCWSYTDSASFAEIWEYMTTDKRFLQNKLNCLQRCDILLSHSPPAGCGMSLLNGQDVGVPGMLNWANQKQCKYIFCGHIHEHSGVIKRFKDTEIINAACTLITFEINI